MGDAVDATYHGTLYVPEVLCSGRQLQLAWVRSRPPISSTLQSAACFTCGEINGGTGTGHRRQTPDLSPTYLYTAAQSARWFRLTCRLAPPIAPSPLAAHRATSVAVPRGVHLCLSNQLFGWTAADRRRPACWYPVLLGLLAALALSAAPLQPTPYSSPERMLCVGVFSFLLWELSKIDHPGLVGFLLKRINR